MNFVLDDHNNVHTYTVSVKCRAVTCEWKNSEKSKSMFLLLLKHFLSTHNSKSLWMFHVTYGSHRLLFLFKYSKIINGHLVETG